MSNVLGQALSLLNRSQVSGTGVTNLTSQRNQVLRKETFQGHSNLQDLESWSLDSEARESSMDRPKETSWTLLCGDLTV